MDILFIGKRFYTNRDAYSEKFGRIYQLPYHWSKKTKTKLWLIDYHTKENIKDTDDQLEISSTAIFSFSFIFKLISIIIFERPKTIVASGDCYIGLLGLVLSKICFSKFVFDIYDKYDAFKGYRNFGFKNLLLFLIKNSNINFFASKLLAKEIHCNTPYKIIPNGINYHNFIISTKNSAREKLKLDQDVFIIGYIGSIEYERGITDLIHAVKTIKQEDQFKNLTLLIAGKNSHNINLDYDFIKYLGNLNFNEVPSALSACDILAIPYRRSEQINYGTSCKIVEYIATQKPIVATESANILEDFPAYQNQLPNDYLAKCNNINSLIETIKKQITQPIILECIVEMSWDTISDKALNSLMEER